MRAGTITAWEKRGWMLDPTLLQGLGEINNTAGCPYYIGEDPELGYDGKARPIFPSRWAMGRKIGRPLLRSEILRFRGEDKKDLRLSNLILHSKQATSAELLKANGGPVLGYSHCLCECGTELDLARQKVRPYAFVEGHKPVKKDHGNLKRARKSKEKILVMKLNEDPIKKIPAGYPLLPKEQAVPEDSMKEFRTLFEKMIHSLPWVEFKELLHLLLEIQTRKKN